MLVAPLHAAMTGILTRLAALTATDGNGLLPCPFRGNPDYTIRYE